MGTITDELDYPSTRFQPKLNTMSTLTDQEIHIWYADIHQFRNQVDAESLLSLSESERHQGFLDHESKAEFLLGRYLVRTKLSLYYNKILASDWKFQLSPHGKPAVVNSTSEPLHFSLSHSGGKVACAFSKNLKIGIDIESNQREKPYLALAERFFSKTEFENIKKLPLNEQAHLFFKYWSLKEAYSKATGLGFQTAFDSFSFLIEDENKIQILLPANEDPKNWKFFLLSTVADFQTALAVYSEKNIQVKQFFL